jgi:hypothetical protein
MPTNEEINGTINVIKDRVDMRDIPYTPTLRPLNRSLDVVAPILEDPELVRNQMILRPGDKDNATCTAQALASVVDILRRIEMQDAKRVSHGMIYECGRQIEAQDQVGDYTGLRSLRSAIKGFYHNGVCEELTWDSEFGSDANDKHKLMIERFKQARGTPLGSYYRIQPILNDYHAALNEVGVIYAAAEIHGGWTSENVAKAKGKIKIFDDDETHGQLFGNHAFAIVGYSSEGFYVLNSWGPEWGGLTLEPEEGKNGRGKPMPGIALWSYQDWAERILDGWVLRLGVSAPDAFRFSFSRQGIGDFSAYEIKAGSTPRYELMGHYIHMDDSKFVKTGAIASTFESVQATRQLIDEKREVENTPTDTNKRSVYKKVLLWITGGAENTKDIMRHVARSKDYWKARGVYPITVLWCSDLLDQSGPLLERLGEEAFKLVGHNGPELDRRMELDARAIGRAVWRDVEWSAEWAASPPKPSPKESGDSEIEPKGAMYRAFMELKELNRNIEIHVVAEGAGAILMSELLKATASDILAWTRLESLTLIAPACSLDAADQFLEWGPKRGNKLNILLPDEATKRRFRFGHYGGSILDLAQMSFVEHPPKRKTAAGPNSKGESEEPEEIATDSRMLGLMTKSEIENWPGYEKVPVQEITLPAGTGPINSLRFVSAGREALKLVHDIVLGKDKHAGNPPEYGQDRLMRKSDDVRPSSPGQVASTQGFVGA